MTIWLSITAVALADPPKHIEVPDPLEAEQPAPAPEPAPAPVPAPEAPPVAAATPIAPPSRPRTQGNRKVQGEAPANLFGRYYVAEMTEAGETEDFAIKMERAGNALNEDCIIVHLGFDFGPPPAEGASGHRPVSVEIAQVERCIKGGLGTYAQELAIELPATWGTTEGAVTLTLPAATVMSDYVRLRKPEDGDMRTPSQWLAPEARVERKESVYRIVAEPSRRRGELPVLHLTDGDVVLHLEADPGGPFAKKQ